MSYLSLDEVRVLHVDDAPDFAEIVKEFLERETEKLTIRSATTIDDGVSILHEERIECVVSDYDFPTRDGLEFLEVVRDEYPELPFILFTGKGSETIASRAISAGVTDYLQKQSGTNQFTILANRILNSVRISRAKSIAERTEDRYHNLVDTAPIPILLFDEDRRLVYANDAAVTFLRADSKAQLKGKPFTEFLHPEDRDVSTDRFEKLMAEDTSAPEREYRVQTLDGECKTATVATAPGYYRGEKVAQAMIRE
jgi:PAS domain S-box-containing protein